jgi:hypothetical protein
MTMSRLMQHPLEGNYLIKPNKNYIHIDKDNYENVCIFQVYVRLYEPLPGRLYIVYPF